MYLFFIFFFKTETQKDITAASMDEEMLSSKENFQDFFFLEELTPTEKIGKIKITKLLPQKL